MGDKLKTYQLKTYLEEKKKEIKKNVHRIFPKLGIAKKTFSENIFRWTIFFYWKTRSVLLGPVDA